MSSDSPLPRRLALLLMAHARRILGAKRAFWAEGMETELGQITNDWDALRWSVGCVLASYKIVITLLPVWNHAARNTLAFAILYFSYDSFIGPLWAFGCTAPIPTRIIGLLANLPSDFITCVNWPSVPMSLRFVSIAASLLFAFSAIQTLRRRRSAFAIFVFASMIASIAFVFEQGIQAYTQYWHSPAVGIVITHIAISKIVIPLLVANAIWLFTFKRGDHFKTS